MTKDRLEDFRANIAFPDVSYRRLSQQNNSNDKQSITINIDNEIAITDFLSKINDIRLAIDKVNQLAQDIKILQTKVHNTPLSSKLNEELVEKNIEIKQLYNDTAERLKKIELIHNDLDQNSAQRRIKESQLFVLSRHLRDIMMDYNRETVIYRDRCKKVIVEQLRLVGDRKTNDELEDIVDNNLRGDLRISALVDIQKSKQTLSELEIRHQNLLQLENAIIEVRNMIGDLAEIIGRHGEMIDCIEHNVSRATDYTIRGVQDVNKANTYRRQALRKKFIIIIVLIVAVLLIFFIFFFGSLTQRKLWGK